MRTACTLLDTGGDLLVREPCRHRTADLSKVILSVVRSHPIVVLQGWCRFCARSAANCLQKTVAALSTNALYIYSLTHYFIRLYQTYVRIIDTLNNFTHFSSFCRSVVKNSSTNTTQRKNEKQTDCCVCRKKHHLSHAEALHMQALDNRTPSSTYSMVLNTYQTT